MLEDEFRFFRRPFARGIWNRCLAKTDPACQPAKKFILFWQRQRRRVLGGPLEKIRVAGWGLRPHHSADHRIKNQI